ncbi:MAG: APC family permease [Clostridia bacterium]|nr:APC family permease [Clostridia bacterium]
MATMTKKYGLMTAIAMVTGVVVGSGVFFKAEKILNATGGDLKLGILSWIAGGLIMLACAYAFSILANRIEKVNGLVDYAEALVGKKYAYFIGWFTSVIYYPCLTMALAWVTARYTCVLFFHDQADITGGLCMTLAGFYLILSFAINLLSPVIAGKVQVSTTVIKLIPLFLMAIVGTIYGLTKGYTVENFTTVVREVETGPALFTAICATAFAYDGWIVATTINAELKDAKKNLPRALVFGSLAVIIIYILYYVGLAGGISNADMMAGGETGAKLAFEAVFGKIGGTAVFVFVIISCFGTLNGLTLACSRGMYALACRNQGIKPQIFKQVDKATNMAPSSATFGILMCIIWMVFFYCSQFSSFGSKLGIFAFDPTELPIVTSYFLYIPIFVMMLFKLKDVNGFKRFIAPIIAIIGCIFMMVATIYSHQKFVIGYLIVFIILNAAGMFFSSEKKKAK